MLLAGLSVSVKGIPRSTWVILMKEIKTTPFLRVYWGSLCTTILVGGPINVPCALFPCLPNQLPNWLLRRLSKSRELKLA